jgi:4-amino-4-deoxy-L-arabinose transferase-like glycosyltransferase
MGLMTKGFLALMLPVLIALPYMIWQRRFGELVRYGLVAAVAALVSVPWALAVHYREPDFWRFFFWHEHIRRFAAGEDAQHARPWWFYLPAAVCFYLAMGPAVAFDAAAHLARKTRSENRLPRLVVPAAAGIFQREQRQTADLHHAVPAAVGPVDGLHGNELDS